MSRGILIAFEGIDGTGKSTQIKLLAARLRDMGHDVVVTCEPTKGKYGRRIRQIFIDRQRVSPAEELELFINDRREHVRDLINPALAAGKIVLTDRYYFSTAAYQGAAGQDPQLILQMNEEFAPAPDLVLLIKLPPAVGVYRIQTIRNETLNDFEQEDILQKVDDIFDTMAHDFITRIDGRGTTAEVQTLVMAQVEHLLAAG